MPRQEEMAIKRISTIANLLKEAEIMEFEDLAAWCLINQGIMDRTVGRYMMALVKMEILSYDPSTKIIKYIKEQGKEPSLLA